MAAAIITGPLGDLLRRVRRNPSGALEPGEELDPRQIALLIARPKSGEAAEPAPRWLQLLRSLFSGIYTIDNMDFVLRDAYMSGYSARAFDLARLLHYSFFSEQGLTIHARGIAALVSFMSVRADLFRTVYFHRTVRRDRPDAGRLVSGEQDLPVSGQPAGTPGRVPAIDRVVAAGGRIALARQPGPAPARTGQCRWQRLLDRDIPWKMACQRNLVFDASQSERSSVFSRADIIES